MTVTIVAERLARLDTITLDKGSHESPEQGMCFIEFADWLAGGPGRDSAPTVSPVIRAYGIALNDAWDAEQRQKLRPYGPRVVGTAGDGQDPARFILARQSLESLRAKVRELLATNAVAAAAAAAAVAADAVAAAAAWGTYDVAYEAARKAYAESTDPIMVKVRELGNRQQQTALTLLDQLIDPSAVAS